MKAIVPAAGIGKRLRPHTYTLPKALLQVAGKPIISHILDDVLPLEPSSIVVIVGYKGELVRSFIEKHYAEAPIEFVFQGERKGIGHAIHLTKGIANTGEPLLVVLGDTIIKTDLSHIISSDANILGVKAVENPRRFGVCEVDDGRIVRLVEKPEDPPSNLAIIGLYYLLDSSLLFECLDEEIRKDIQKFGEYQVTDALQMMIDRGAEFRPFQVNDWFDCGKKEALLETNRKLLEGKEQSPEVKESVIVPPVSISPTAEIEKSIIGPYVSIAARAVVKNSIIRDSIIDEAASVTNCLLEGSVVGSNAVIAGVFQKLNVCDSSEVSVE